MAVPVADLEDIQQCAVKLAAQQTRLMVLKDQKVALVGRIAKLCVSAHVAWVHLSFMLQRRRDMDNATALYLRPTPMRKVPKAR